MFHFKLLFTASLVCTSTQCVGATQRRLRHSSKSNKNSSSSNSDNQGDYQQDFIPALTATLLPLNKDYKNLVGDIIVDYDEMQQLEISYEIITGGAKKCEDCVLAIYNGKTCNDLGTAFDTDGSYTSDKDGAAVGTSKLDVALTKTQIECKFFVVFGAVKESKDVTCEKEFEKYEKCIDDAEENFDDCVDGLDDAKDNVDDLKKEVQDCKKDHEDCDKIEKEFKDAKKAYEDDFKTCTENKKDDEEDCDELKEDLDDCKAKQLLQADSAARGEIVGCGQLVQIGNDLSSCAPTV